MKPKTLFERMDAVGWVPLRHESARVGVKAIEWTPRAPKDGGEREAAVSPESARQELDTYVREQYGNWGLTHLRVPGALATDGAQPSRRSVRTIFDEHTNPVVLQAKTMRGRLALWIDHRALLKAANRELKRSSKSPLRVLPKTEKR